MIKQLNDVRLIEAGFPCHQVGAETQRERNTGLAPPTHRLHVWWARRPLTPSRAAILASLLPADTDTDWFLRQLGIEKVQAIVNGVEWTLDDILIERIINYDSGKEILIVDSAVIRALEREQNARAQQRELIDRIVAGNPMLNRHTAIVKWRNQCIPIPGPLPAEDDILDIERKAADPAWFKELMYLAADEGIRIPNLYGYSRAYSSRPEFQDGDTIVLDPTAGGGSIPFEALRLGCKVIANDLNPVAAVILMATLDYPTRFNIDLIDQIDKWGEKLIAVLNKKLEDVFPMFFHYQNMREIICQSI